MNYLYLVTNLKILLFIFLFSKNINAQENFIFSLTDFDVNKTISQIFDAEFDEKEKVFYWKPNFDERFKLKYESEKFLMTTIGTVLYNSEKTFYTIVTFTFHPNEKLPILGFIGLEIDDSGNYLILQV